MKTPEYVFNLGFRPIKLEIVLYVFIGTKTTKFSEFKQNIINYIVTLIVTVELKLI
jgi:hypothetical protein